MYRKLVGLGFLVLVLSTGATAQEKQSWKDKHSVISFNAGLSIPIVCYASDNVYNKFAGFAKPGFSLDVTYGYYFGQNLGIVSSFFFAGNKINELVVRAPDKEGYHYYGLLVGPMLSKNFSPHWDGDLRFMAGIARARVPKLVQGDETIINKDIAYSFTWSAGAGLRYIFNDNTFLSFRADQTQLKPQLNGTGVQKGEQHIVVVNLGAGMGLKF